MSTPIRSLTPSAACQAHLDKAYKDVQELLVAHGDPILTNQIASGGHAVADTWLQQAHQHAAVGEAQACHQALRGWYRAVKACVDAAPRPAAVPAGQPTPTRPQKTGA